MRLAVLGSGKSLRLEMDGVDVTGSVAVPDTGGADSWTTVSIPGVELEAGTHVLRAFHETGDTNLNWIAFESAAPAVSAPGRPFFEVGL